MERPRPAPEPVCVHLHPSVAQFVGRLTCGWVWVKCGPLDTETLVVSSGGTMNAEIPVRFLLVGLLVLPLAAGFAPVSVAYGAEAA